MANQNAAGNPSPGLKKRPDYQVDFIPTPRRLRVKFNDIYVADTLEGRVLRESNHVPVYYFPLGDIDDQLLTKTDLKTFCPYKGEASYWTLNAKDRTAENAVWTYENPFDESQAIKGYAAFYWNKMDHWYEEDEEIFVHPRDPFKRVDVVESRRNVKVTLGGETIADTTGARFLFETGLPVRYYIPAGDVRMDLLTPSDTSTSCPYKGTASYYSATVGGETFADIAWYYVDPIAECPRIKDLICFYNENVDAIDVDGETIPRADTRWSTRYRGETLDGPDHIV